MTGPQIKEAGNLTQLGLINANISDNRKKDTYYARDKPK